MSVIATPTSDGVARQKVFGSYFATNFWGNSETVSGVGSTIGATSMFRERLPLLLRALEVKSILDLPCGDFNYMQFVDLTGINYIGADIVPGLIERNRRDVGENDFRQFLVLDACADQLPKVDLVISRDMVIHLPNKDVARFLARVRESESKYLLLGRYLLQFGDIPTNADIPLGRFRAVDPCAPPFGLRAPILSIPERQSIFKSMALWRVSDLPTAMDMPLLD